MKLIEINGWSFILTLSLKKDSDFYDDFNISATLSNCYCIDKLGIRRDHKFFIFELFCRRLFELKMEKINEEDK